MEAHEMRRVVRAEAVVLELQFELAALATTVERHAKRIQLKHWSDRPRQVVRGQADSCAMGRMREGEGQKPSSDEPTSIVSETA